MTQLVDGNWGVYGLVPKAVFDPVHTRRALALSQAKAAKDVKAGRKKRKLQSEYELPLSADTVRQRVKKEPCTIEGCSATPHPLSKAPSASGRLCEVTCRGAYGLPISPRARRGAGGRRA